MRMGYGQGSSKWGSGERTRSGRFEVVEGGKPCIARKPGPINT